MNLKQGEIMKFGTLMAVVILLPTMVFATALETAFLPNGAEYLVDRFVVTTTTDTAPLITESLISGTAYTGVSAIDDLCAEFDVVKVDHYYDGPVKSAGLKDLIPRMYIFHVAPGADVMAAHTAFRSCANIEVSDLYEVPHICYDPNDPQRTSQWHLTKIQAYQAWDVIRGDSTSGPIISIDDTGVYWMHSDLAPNMWINEAEDINHNGTMDSGDYNGFDDDGNGYVDDVIGWDSGSNDNDPREETPTHGTHVAGCASEATDNGLQGAGIGFSVRLMANKGANSANQLTAVYPAMIWAAENGANIVNCSWGSDYYSSNSQNIINGLWNSGVVVVAAAGNNGNSQSFYPAAYNNVLAVAATNSGDYKASWSSYGTFVDVSAPGAGIYATWSTSSFIALDGTSMASPITAGTCGLLWATNPGYTNQDIVDIIIATTDNIDDLNPNYAGMIGSGRINAYSALASSNTPNINPTDQQITITDDDGDEVLNPGESFDLVLTLTNEWADAFNVTATVRSNDNFIATDSVASFGNIPRHNGSSNSSDPFSITAAPDADLGSLSINLTIQADGYLNETSFNVDVSLDQAGFPLEIPGFIEASPLIYDVDRDQDSEIIFGSNDDKVFVLEADGQNSSGWPKSVSGDVVTGPAAGDLAHNGTRQVVAVTKTGNLYAWNSNGTLLPNFPVALGGIVFSGVALGDIDGNQDLEIVVGSFSNNNLYVIQHDGSNMSGWPVNNSGKWYGSPAVADIDNDSKEEIICAGFDSLLHVYNDDGSSAPGFPVQLDNAVWTTPAIGDVDGDEDPEIAVVTTSGSLYLVNDDGSILSGFPIDLGTNLRATPSMADIDGDGMLDVLFGGNDGNLHVIKSNGDEAPGFPKPTDGAISASPSVGDLTGDSNPDIIIGTNSGSIYGFEYNGATMGSFPISTLPGAQIVASAALGDLDLDNDMEFVVGVKATGENLIVIDYKANASWTDLLWPNFGGDNRRSCNAAGIMTSVDDNPVQPVIFGLAQNYPNPFNASTSISFSIATPGEVNLSIFDLLGRKVNTLESGFMPAGQHSLVWNGTDASGKIVSSGVYFYRLQSADGNETRRMLLLK